MEITNIRYSVDQGHPILEMELDGKPARLHAEPKPTVLAAGIVVLGSGFEDLPPIPLQDVEIQAATQDPGVLAEYLKFGSAVRDGSFQAS